MKFSLKIELYQESQKNVNLKKVKDKHQSEEKFEKKTQNGY